MASIRQSLKWLFSKSYRKEQRMEQSVQAYLSALPTCHQFVLVADPEFGESEYFCGVTLSASDLLAWYRKKVEQTTGYSWDGKGRRALLLWLEHAHRGW